MTEITPRNRSTKGLTTLLVSMLLGIHAGLLAWSACLHSPTSDEPVHLAAGIRYVQDGRFDMDLGNPPLVGLISATPVTFMNPHREWETIKLRRMIRKRFVEQTGPRILWYVIVARWACIPISLFGGFICFRWGADLYGNPSGLLALTLWCFSPMVISHGQLINGDMAAMTFGIAAFYAFWKWLNESIIQRAAIAGAALGLAELAKYLWIILYVLLMIAWIAWRSSDRRNYSFRLFLRDTRHLTVTILLSFYIINICYGFENTLSPLGDFRISEKIQNAVNFATGTSNDGARDDVSEWITSIPVPFPENYVRGIDATGKYYEKVKRKSYLLGEWKTGGWWYYYIYGLLVKIPLGTWLLFFLSCLFIVFRRSSIRDCRSEWLLMLPMVAVIIFVTLVTNIHHHVRYVAPVLPFAFVSISKLAQSFTKQDRLFALPTFLSLTWMVVSSMQIYPHSMSYFNELAGGPKCGHKHLIDSNIAWGQDLFFLKKWIDKHPEAQPLAIASVGMIDPRLCGITYTGEPPRIVDDFGKPLDLPANQVGPIPGWYALSVHQIRRPPFQYYLRFQPTAMIGYSIYIYHIKQDEANKIRKELGLPPLSLNNNHFAQNPTDDSKQAPGLWNLSGQ